MMSIKRGTSKLEINLTKLNKKIKYLSISTKKLKNLWRKKNETSKTISKGKKSEYLLISPWNLK